MGTFPPTVSPAGGATAPGAPSPAGAPAGQPSGGSSPMMMKLVALSQAIQQIGQQYPNATQGVQMMLQGLRLVQSAAMQQQAPQPQAAPPTG